MTEKNVVFSWSKEKYELLKSIEKENDMRDVEREWNDNVFCMMQLMSHFVIFSVDEMNSAIEATEEEWQAKVFYLARDASERHVNKKKK